MKAAVTMSGRFAILPAHVVVSDLTPREKSVWAALALRAGPAIAEVWAHVKTLAAEMHCCLDTVRRALRSLCEKGFLFFTGKRHDGRHNVYKMSWEEVSCSPCKANDPLPASQGEEISAEVTQPDHNPPNLVEAAREALFSNEFALAMELVDKSLAISWNAEAQEVKRLVTSDMKVYANYLKSKEAVPEEQQGLLYLAAIEQCRRTPLATHEEMLADPSLRGQIDFLFFNKVNRAFQDITNEQSRRLCSW